MTPDHEPAAPLGRALIARVFLPFAAGFFLSYVFRVVNAVIGPDLAREVALGAEDLGLLTSAYFLTFAAFQLPLGVLLDRFGPRRVEAALLLAAALGAVLFASASTLGGLALARALIGFGVSACLMAGFKAFVVWFPEDRLPLANGALVAFGGAGALAATAPAEALSDLIGWRGLFLGLAAFALMVALLLVTVVPEKPVTAAPERLRDLARNLGAIGRSRVFWRYAPLLGILHGGYLAIQSLWAGPWLRDVAHLASDDAAGVLFVVAAAMIAGSLGIGWLAERLGRRGVPLAPIVGIGSVLLLAVEAAIAAGLGAGTPWLPWLAFGFCAGFAALMYVAVARGFDRSMAGRAVTSLNLFLFAGAFAAQYAIGWIIDRVPGSTAEAYAPAGYTMGFGALVAAQLVAFGWFLIGGRRA